jgi:replicative DNA helicase
MEMAAAQIVERSLAGAGNMSVSRLRNPLDMQDEDWARLTAAMETLNDRDIWIVDATDLTSNKSARLPKRISAAIRIWR